MSAINKTQSIDKARYLSEYSTRDLHWDTDRAKTDEVAQIYASDQQFARRGERAYVCNQRILFAQQVSRDTGELRLALRYGEFCHVPFCPVCCRRRSMRWMRRLWEALPPLLDERPTARFLFLTLTVKNPPVENLRETLRQMNAAWQRLIQRKKFRSVLGWLRSTEITYGNVPGGCHPHFHAVLWVPASWFKRDYVTHADWVKLWRECLRADYDPSVKIKRVRPKKSSLPENATPADVQRAALEAGVIETLKYTVKSSDIVRDPAWFLELARQAYGMRMVAAGGRFREVLRVDDDITDEEMIGADGSAVPDEFEESGLWLAFDWGRPEKRYRRNPKADRIAQ